MRSFLAGLRRLVIPWGATADQPRVVISTDDPLLRAFSDAGISFYHDAGHGYVVAVEKNGTSTGIFRIVAGPADSNFAERNEYLHAEYDTAEPLLDSVAIGAGNRAGAGTRPEARMWFNTDPDTLAPVSILDLTADLVHVNGDQAATRGWVAGHSGVSVMDFGARGDGIADDTAAFQAALDSTPGRLFVPAGTYRVTSGLRYKSPRTVIAGVGDNSVIACDGAAVATLLGGNTAGLARCGLRDVKLLQTNATAQGVGLDTSDMPNFLGDNVRIEAFGTGHRMVDVGNTSFYSHFGSFLIFDCVNGIVVGGSQANQNTWLNPRVRPRAGGGGVGISLVDARGLTFIGADVEPGAGAAAGITGVSLDATTRECWFINPWIENNDTGLLVAAGVRRCGLVGGSVTSNLTADIANAADPTEVTFLGTNRTGQTQWSLGYVLRGAGTPEGAVAAPVGTMFLRTDGGAGTTLYVKQTGTGNTGWTGK